MPYTELPDEKIGFKVSSWNKFHLRESMFYSLKFLVLGELLLNVQNPEVTPQPTPGRQPRSQAVWEAPACSGADTWLGCW